MRDEKRAQNAPETAYKDTNNFADEQVKNLPFQVGEIVLVKSDGPAIVGASRSCGPSPTGSRPKSIKELIKEYYPKLAELIEHGERKPK